MRSLSITGLVLGVIGPLVLMAPAIAALISQDGIVLVFLLLTVPLGLALSIAGTVLVIVAAALALRRRYRPRPVAVVGIVLAGSGLLLQMLGALAFFGPTSGGEASVVGAGLVIGLTGVIMCSVVGLNPVLRWRR